MKQFTEARIFVTLSFELFPLFDIVLYQSNDLFELFFYKKKKEEENCIDISCNCPKVLNR